MSKWVSTVALSLLFVSSAVFLAIEPPPVWQTESIDPCAVSGNANSAPAAGISTADPHRCTVLGPRIDWG